jgi:rod shape-determining protein MreC
VTSGVGAKFPEGMPIGKIAKIQNHRQGLYIEAMIEPYVQFNRLENVLVLTKTSKDNPAKRREVVSQILKMSVKQ